MLLLLRSLVGIFKSEEEDKYIHCVISTKDQSIIKVFDIPMIKSYFTGVGDLFSALLLDKFYKTNTMLQ